MSFPLLHDWATPVSEVLSFQTNIFTTEDGSEQRRSERFIPRREFTVSPKVKGDAFRRLLDALHTRDESSVYLPDYGKQMVGAAIENSTTLTSRSLPSWMVNGAEVCVFTESYILVTTISGAGSYSPPVAMTINPAQDFYQISLADQMPIQMTDYAFILPVISGHPAPAATFNGITDELADFSIKVTVDPGSETLASISSASEFPLLDGREIFTTKPNFSRPPSFTVDANFDAVDYGRGVIEYFKPIAFPQNLMQHTFLGRRAGDIRDILGLFCRAAGRQGEFWMPTWMGDLRASGGILSGASYLRVAGTYVPDPVNAGVAITLHDGTILTYRVTGCVASSNTDTNYPVPAAFDAGFSESFGFPQYGIDPIQTVLLLNGAPSHDILYTDIAQVSWLRLTRFAKDSLTVQWHTDDLADCLVSTQALKYLPVENV